MPLILAELDASRCKLLKIPADQRSRVVGRRIDPRRDGQRLLVDKSVSSRGGWYQAGGPTILLPIACENYIDASISDGRAKLAVILGDS